MKHLSLRTLILSHYVSLRETRNSVQSWNCSASPRNHLETNSQQISEHLTRQDGQQTTHKEHFQETSKSQKIVVGLKVYFKEPVNLIEIRSCQNMFLKRFLSPFSSLFQQKLTMLHNRVRAPESSDSCNCQRRSFLKRNFTLSIIIPFLIKLPSFVVSCPSWKWKVASTKPIKFKIIHISYQNCFLIVHNLQYFVIQVTLLQAKTEVDVIYFSMQRVGLEALLHQLCLDLAITGTFEITI